MTATQKNTLIRIITAAVLFFTLLVLEHKNVLDTKIFGSEWLLSLLLFAVPYIIIGYDIFFKSVKNIKNGQIFDENFLMTVASLAAFGIHEFPEAVAVMLFYQVGELFQSYAVEKSRKSISSMLDIAPEFANLEQNGTIVQVDPENVKINDTIIIKPGERIPLDGIVIEGESLIDTAALTGEVVPRKVHVNDSVISGCINGSGTLKVLVQKLYEDSTVSRILELVENASSKKAHVENFITRFARYYTPAVIALAAFMAIVLPFVFGNGFSAWIERACIFLVISCPCALVISVPLGFFGGIGASSKIGVLVKGGNYLEIMGSVKTIVFDKTGTITKGEFKVKDILPSTNMPKEELLEIAAACESYSNHPIANSICEAYQNRVQTLHAKEIKAENAKELSGLGIEAFIDGKKVLLGNAKLMHKEGILFTKTNAVGSVVHIARDNIYLGAIVIADTIKEGVKDAILNLKSIGIEKCIMLSGDHESVAKGVAKETCIDAVYADLLPKDKVEHMERLLKEQTQNKKIAYVGDGINDAPVLSRADVGIAMGSLGSDAAIEAADIVIMNDSIEKIPQVICIARKTMRIVRENIVFALTVKFLIMILGAIGIANMWMAVFGDVGVAMLAILNSMRTLKLKK